MSPPLVCSVVLTWNNFADTNECLRALQAVTYANHRIILVDNGSDDGSAEQLLSAWKHNVEYVRWETNRGCGAGYNLGLRHALGLGADYVAIVDNDIVVEPGIMAALLQPFEGRNDVGLTVPIVVRHDDPSRVWFARGEYRALLGITRHLGINRALEELPYLAEGRWSTDYAPTCAVLISREALERVGLMDDRLFFGHDDVDWCLRARDAGLESVVVGQLLATHKVSTTGGIRGSTVFTAFSAYHHAKGSVLVGRKRARGPGILAYAVGQLGVRFPYYSLQMLRAGQPFGGLAYARGLVDGFRAYVWPGKEG